MKNEFHFSGGDINYKSSFGRTPIQIAVVADQMKIIDFLLENDADVEVSDLNGDNAISTAKKFSNKLAQHRYLIVCVNGFILVNQN